MLSEGFLTTMKYRRGSVDSPTATQHKNSSTAPPADSCVDSSFPHSPLSPRPTKAGRPKATEQFKSRRIAVSKLSDTPQSNSTDEFWGLELYRSWCCPSLCKNYPDLQLGGDQLGDRSSQSPQWLDPSDDGPLLCSQDLESLEPLQGPEPPTSTGTRLGSQPGHDDDNMEMETALPGLESIKGPERLSNSMLNGYLETKLLEVYRQHIQDSLAHGKALLGPELVPTMVPGSPAESSGQWVAQVEEPSSGSIRYLSTCSVASDSHFTSPDLRISNPHTYNEN